MLTKKVPSTQDDYFLDLIPYTAPWWRKSETEVAGTRQVDGIGVAGGDNPMLPSHCQTQQFLITEKVPSTQDDDFLAPNLYKAPPRWRKSETDVGIQRVDGTDVGGCGLEVVGVRVGVVRERGELQEGRGVNCSSLLAHQNALERLA